MAILTRSQLSSWVQNTRTTKTFSQSVRLAETDQSKPYDVFLSHSYLDKETILEINDLLEDVYGLDVYVDWIENPDLDRVNVTHKSANALRSAMDRSKCLIYAVSANSASSKWMPWELGYSDAKHGKIAVLPIANYSNTLAAYRSLEFVSLYPYIEINPSKADATKLHLWVHDPQLWSTYIMFDEWAKGYAPYPHDAD